MTDSREIEAKFEIDDTGRQTLANVESIGSFAILGRDTVTQDDLYFDTSDSCLANHGSTLRVRRTPKGGRVTFKGRREVSGADDAHVAVRLEDEVRLSDEDTQAVSSTAALPRINASPLGRARALVGEADLMPTARIETTRATLLVGRGELVEAEIALDECRGTRFSDGRVVCFGEVEVESKSGDRDALNELTNALQQVSPGLKPSMVTKLQRVMD